MKREDAYFTSVGNNFCCSEHFLLNDVNWVQIEIGSRTLGFPVDKRWWGVSNGRARICEASGSGKDEVNTHPF